LLKLVGADGGKKHQYTRVAAGTLMCGAAQKEEGTIKVI
jgi:hypothetical protein